MQTTMNKSVRLHLKFDIRNSFITNTRADIWGLKAGVQFANLFAVEKGNVQRQAGKIKMGIGYNWLRTKMEKDIVVGSDTILARLRLNYPVFYFEYIFYAVKHWELSVPLQLGIGSSSYRYSYIGTRL